MGDYYTRYSWGLGMYSDRYPYVIALAATFVGNLMRSLQTQTRVDGYLGPINSHMIKK